MLFISRDKKQGLVCVSYSLQFNGGALYLQVEELALQSMISTEREDSDASSPAQPDLAEVGDTLVPVTVKLRGTYCSFALLFNAFQFQGRKK